VVLPAPPPGHGKRRRMNLPFAATDATPRLSVVIPTLGRPILLKTLDSLIRAEGFDRLEILIAGRLPDDAVRAGVLERLRGHANIRHLDVSFPRGDSSNKKNAGWRAARAELVAFIDDDVVVASDWPAQIIAPFIAPAVGLVSGPSLIPHDLPRLARWAGWTLASPAAGYVAKRYLAGDAAPRPVAWSRLIGCNMAFRRAVLEKIGGFETAFWPGEEMIAAFRATRGGARLVFNPGAALRHYPRATLRSFGRQVRGYGATRIRLVRAGVECELAPLVPGIALALGLLLVVAGWWWPMARETLLFGAALYLLFCLAAAGAVIRQTRRGGDWPVALLIPWMHLNYALAQWTEFFHPNRDLSQNKT